jgi:hypothetical protein
MSKGVDHETFLVDLLTYVRDLLMGQRNGTIVGWQSSSNHN